MIRILQVLHRWILAALIIGGTAVSQNCPGARPDSAKNQAKSESVTESALFQGWHKTWDTAAAKAIRLKKPLVVVAIQNGCQDCHRDMTALQTHLQGEPAFSGFERLVLAVGERAEALDTAQQMGIKKTPTLILYVPDNGSIKELGRSSGQISIRDYNRLKQKGDEFLGQQSDQTVSNDSRSTSTSGRRIGRR